MAPPQPSPLAGAGPFSCALGPVRLVCGATIRGLNHVLGGTMRHTATAVLAACLLLAGCSSGGEPEKTKATATPSLSTTEARQACVDAWLAVLKADDYDPEKGLEARPEVCEGLPGQAAMYAEALRERNAENRERHDECTRDPECTDFPVP